MRSFSILMMTLAACMPLPTSAQSSRFVEVDNALQSGDGRGPDTPYAVPGMLWEYLVLSRLNLRFQTQRTDPASGLDVVAGRDPKTGNSQEVWFRAAIPDNPSHATTDRIAREIMTSGDGLTPETAFVVGGSLDAEYQILKFMGISANRQSLVGIRGCSFDVQSGTDLDTHEPRQVYFLLGKSAGEDGGKCILRPAP